MKSSIVLVTVATLALLACGKADEAPPASGPAPAMDSPPPAAPATPEPVTDAAEAVPPAAPATAPEPVPPPKASAPSVPPPAAAPAPVAAPAPAPAPAQKTPDAAPAAPRSDLARGEQVYRQSCAVCHDKGVAGAPRTGDAAAWSPRLARGMDAMYATALNGKGAMPAKGGNPALSEADVKSAVDYLAAQLR